jgi:uncharacterized 2Fe-2S/4Fe-4S cluster protein (DUF4445 family)
MGSKMLIRLSTGRTFEYTDGENILQALKKHGVYLVSSCGGKGTCGKCRIKILSGNCSTVKTGKLEPHERESGIVLACRTFPSDDIFIDIPKESLIVLGDVIEISRAQDIYGLFRSLDNNIAPLVKHIRLEVKPPSIENNTGDLERLIKAAEEKGVKGLGFSRALVATLAESLRDAAWEVDLAFIDGAEALTVNPYRKKIRYGIAADIGTTTVVVYIVNLLEGSVVDVGSTYNSQIRCGDDVITRIIFATEGGGLEELRDTVITDINNLLSPMLERHNIKAGDIETAVVAGNTTMMHIFWGLNPGYIREEPYTPTLNAFPLWKAWDAGITINAQAPLFTVPCVASYVGGDIVAGVVASGMHRKTGISLFIDIGTNGEIVIGNNEWLVTAACSAGPCFEGSGIKHGMRATEGAIESVRIDPVTFEPSFGVIGNTQPAGICGSGMIDAITEMFLTGVIDQKGKFVEDTDTKRIRKGFEGPEFLFFSDNQRDVVLTGVDIENIIRSKAAIYAGISLLLKKVGLTIHDIENVFIAGGFGNCLNVDKAIAIGMLPDIPRGKYRFLGNTSIAGAYLCLLSEEMRKETEETARKMTNIELSVSRSFMDEYMSALFLPHTDISLFPTVEKLREK